MKKASRVQPSPQVSAKVWALLITLSILWGGSFLFARIAVKEVPPLMLVLLRVSIAALALHLYLAIRGEWQSFKNLPVRPFLLLGLLNNAIPFSLLFIGQTQLGAGLAAVLNALVPFWTMIAANSLTSDEKFTNAKLTGIALGIVGAAVIIGPGAAAGFGAPLWAKLAVMAAGVSYALASIHAKRFKGLPPVSIATGQLTAASLIMLPFAILVSDVWQPMSVTPKVWVAVAALALASTALAYILFFRIIASAGATVVSLVTLLVPVSALLLGVVFLDENLSMNELCGMPLIGLGLVFIDGRLSALTARPKA